MAQLYDAAIVAVLVASAAFWCAMGFKVWRSARAAKKRQALIKPGTRWCKENPFDDPVRVFDVKCGYVAYKWEFAQHPDHWQRQSCVSMDIGSFALLYKVQL